MTREYNQILDRVEEDNVKFISLQFTDIFGIVKSLTIGAKYLEESLERGTWFDGSSIEGFARIHESDMFLKPDISTYTVIPWMKSEDGNTARFICDVHKLDGKPFEGDPRYILKRVMKETEEMGYTYNTGPELEFFLFKKDGGLKPLPSDRGGYFDLSMDEAYKVRRDMTVALDKFGIDVEASHHEVARGLHEIDFRYDNALKTADNATTLRFVLKAVAQEHGLHATFMPKPITGVPGAGMHVHQSFSDKNGNNVFYDEKDNYKLSKIAYNFLGGQMKHVKAMSAVVSPTVNSYKRLVTGYEAPVYISWASANRSGLIRVPRIHDGRPKAARVELRCADPSCNLYLAFAVMLKAGLDGIKNKTEAPEPIEHDVYGFDERKLAEFKIDQLPYSLWQALKELKKDKVIQEALGEHTYNKYIEAKTKEWDDYRIHVSQWELDKYLEAY